MKTARTLRREIQNIEDIKAIRELEKKQVQNLNAAKFALEWALGKLPRTAQPHAAYCDWQELRLMRSLRK